MEGLLYVAVIVAFGMFVSIFTRSGRTEVDAFIRSLKNLREPALHAIMFATVGLMAGGALYLA
jgi:hypothetical protein